MKPKDHAPLDVDVLASVLVEASESAVEEEIASRSDATLLITGATRGDVETLARRVHLARFGAEAPFVCVGTGTFPSETQRLRERCSELLDAATSGSIFMTDVEEMPPLVQGGLIELLSELQRARAPSAAVRLISGTTVQLLYRIAAGTFSEQLFYRLNLIHLVITDVPPSRAAGAGFHSCLPIAE